MNYVQNEVFGEEIAHIIPLGHEVDRATKPFERLKANRVYLLAIAESEKYSKEMVDKQTHFSNVVKKKLEEAGIEVHHRKVDLFNILEVMKNVADLISKEQSKGNIVYVNMSSAGRLTSVGATLAAMAHGAKVYYVVADRYSKNENEEMEHGLSICKKLKLKFFENFQLKLPDRKSIMIVAKLCKEERGMKTREILDFLRENDVEGFEKDYKKLDRGGKINYLMKLNKGILEKLENNGYITREKAGRFSLIKITESGRYIAHISGLLK